MDLRKVFPEFVKIPAPEFYRNTPLTNTKVLFMSEKPDVGSACLKVGEHKIACF